MSASKPAYVTEDAFAHVLNMSVELSSQVPGGGYSDTPSAQDLPLIPIPRAHIILASNIAESSLTIPKARHHCSTRSHKTSINMKVSPTLGVHYKGIRLFGDLYWGGPLFCLLVDWDVPLLQAVLNRPKAETRTRNPKPETLNPKP